MTRDDSLDPVLDPVRLAVLRETGLLDSPNEANYDRLSRLAARFLGVPVVLVSLVDSDRQFFKSSLGLPGIWAARRETPLSHSFCQVVVRSGEPLVVRDARDDQRVCENLAIRDLGVIAYLGVPLRTATGHVLGSFCAIDSMPRDWTDDQIATMQDLANSVMSEIALRQEKAELLRSEARLSVQHATALILADADSVEQAIPRLLRAIGEGLDLEVAEFWEFDPAQQVLRASPHTWISPRMDRGFVEESRPYRFPTGESLCGRIVSRGEPAWIDDLSDARLFARSDLARRYELKTAFGASITDRERTFGVMVFLARRRLTADPRLLRALSSLSRQVGQFVVRRQAESEAARAGARLQSLLDAATQVGIIATDAEGRIEIFSVGAERMLGFRRGEVIGSNLIESPFMGEEIGRQIAPSRAGTERPLDNIKALVARSRQVGDRRPVWHLARKDGTPILADVTLSASDGPSGAVSGYLTIARDVTAERKSDEEVRKLAALVQHCGELIGTADLDGRITYLNPSGRRLIGLEASGLPGPLAIGDILAEETAALMAAEALPAAIATGQWAGEGRIKHRTSGRAIDVQMNLFLVLSADNDTPVCLALIFLDISDRKRSEAHLKLSETRLQAVIDSALDCVITIDHEGRVLEFNPAAERTFGYARSQALGRDLSQLIIPPELRKDHANGMKRYLATGIGPVLGQRIEVTAMRSDGGTFPVEVAIQAVQITGRPIFTAYLRDISDRKQGERRLLESRQQFRSSFEDAPIGMALVSPQGKTQRVNRALCELVDRVEADLIGESFHQLTLPEDQDRSARLFEKMLAGEIDGYQTKCRFRHKHGHVLWTALSVSLVRDSGRRPLYAIAQIQDVTARKLIEEDLRRTREAAIAANRSKSEFLANMSHEVRTPMSAVLGYAEMLLDPQLTQSERDQALQSIRRNGTHLLQIINDILDLSKIEAGKMEVDHLPYSPWQIVLEVVSSLRVRADEKGVRLETSAGGRLPARCLIDPTRVRQVIVNLVDNAIKFSHRGGAVRIRLSCEQDGAAGADSRPMLQIVVQDQGIGMTPDQLGQLFQPFQQADTSTTRRFGGTGLGLSITRRLTEVMGGSIAVDSEVGTGSSFTVRLPFVALDEEPEWVEAGRCATSVARVEPDRSEPLPRFGGRRVLLAEDSRDNQKVLSYHLKAAGIEVTIAENGRIAVERALAEPFDIILMDMQMPELDGYGATSSLRQSGYTGPVIALTAHAMREDREKCLRAGCTDFLTKPVENRRLLETLARYLYDRPEDALAAPEPIVSSCLEDEDFAALVVEYARSLPRRVSELRNAFSGGNLERVETLMHQCRGVAGMYGYPALGESAGLIEQAVREHQDPELIRELVDEFAGLVERIGLGLTTPA